MSATIDFITGWIDPQSIGTFGPANTNIFGQAFELPDSINLLLSSFALKNNLDTTCTLRAYLYEFNDVTGHTIGAALYSSGVLTPTGSGYSDLTVTPNVQLDPAKTYAMLYQVEPTGSGSGRIALKLDSLYDSVVAFGGFVFQNGVDLTAAMTLGIVPTFYGSNSPSAFLATFDVPPGSASPSISPSPSPGSSGYTLQTVHMSGAGTDGSVQQFNVGKNDNDSPIYYELETQELEFSNRAIIKSIQDKLGVASRYADDSKIEIISDENDPVPINIDMGKRINTITLPQLKGHYITLRWSGNAVNKSPILEGFYLNKIKDDGFG